MINEADSFADKTERHRRIVTTRAAQMINTIKNDAEEAGIVLCDDDVYAISQGCINAAEAEWRAGFLKPRFRGDAEDRRYLPGLAPTFSVMPR